MNHDYLKITLTSRKNWALVPLLIISSTFFLLSGFNLPVVIKTKGDEFEVTNKTIMRKQDFKTTSKVLKYEKWSDKYKKSIDCDNPKGFSQKAHCQGRNK